MIGRVAKLCEVNTYTGSERLTGSHPVSLELNVSAHVYLVASNNGWNCRLHSGKISKQQQQLSPVNSVHGPLPPMQAWHCHAEATLQNMCACPLQYFITDLLGQSLHMHACQRSHTRKLRRPPNQFVRCLSFVPGSKGNLLAVCDVESATAVAVPPLAIPGHLISSSM